MAQQKTLEPAAEPAQQTIDKLDTAALLEEMLSRPVSERSKAITATLNEDQWIATIEDALPQWQKGQARRLVTRAMLTFNENPDLLACTPRSLIACVLEAAECGLVIDNRLAYVQPYNNTKKDADGHERRVREAQFSPSYQGLVFIAKRSGAVHDCYGHCVYEGDKFEHGEMGGRSILEHTWDLGAPRTKVIGAYAKVVLSTNHNDWRYELMDLADLERIRHCSKQPNGPAWKYHPAAMYVKTVIRRALKLYCDDPAFAAAVRCDEREYDLSGGGDRQKPFRLTDEPGEE